MPCPLEGFETNWLSPIACLERLGWSVIDSLPTSFQGDEDDRLLAEQDILRPTGTGREGAL
ncbi:uncharacterized protein METZ01_LOCUS478857, partial [marine metagenome]